VFNLEFTNESIEQLKRLKHNNSLKAEYKSVKKALQYLQNNPKHNSLNSHQYYSLNGPRGEKVFESYAQQKRPNPYRIFWYYGPDSSTLTILNIIPHP